MDAPVNVPVDNPNADTEWNDILRKHGIIPEKAPDPEPIIQQALLDAQRRAYENRLQDKDLDELHDLEDEEDEAFLESYRQKRLTELSQLQKTAVHGQVYHLHKPDYAKEVTEASSKGFVFVHLTSSLGMNVESRILTELWRQMAVKYPDVKFCQIRADMCIEGYPDKNTPTILAYRDGEIRRQIVTLRELNGPRTSVLDLESVLVDVGAVEENDLRRRTRDDEESVDLRTSKPTKEDHDDDSDWD